MARPTGSPNLRPFHPTILETAGVEPESKVDEKLEVFREFVNSLDVTSKKNIAKGRLEGLLPSDPRRSNEGIGRPDRFSSDFSSD